MIGFVLFPTSSSVYFLFGTAFIIWYLQFLWNRRNLYKYARKVDGPFSLPIIGAALNFITVKSNNLLTVKIYYYTYLCIILIKIIRF